MNQLPLLKATCMNQLPLLKVHLYESITTLKSSLVWINYRTEILFGLKHYKLIVTAIHNTQTYILRMYSVLLIKHVKF